MKFPANSFPSNTSELTAYIKSKVRSRVAKKLAHKDILWFVAMYEASAMSEYEQSDIASMLLDGSRKIDDTYVTDWLGLFVQDFYSAPPASGPYELTPEMIDDGDNPFDMLNVHIDEMYSFDE